VDNASHQPEIGEERQRVSGCMVKLPSINMFAQVTDPFTDIRHPKARNRRRPV